MRTAAIVMATMIAASSALAEIAAMRLPKGETTASAGRAMYLRATSSTNGTVEVKRITPFTATWTERATITNAKYSISYAPYSAFVSNIIDKVVSTNGTTVVTNTVTNAVYEAATRATTNISYRVENLVMQKSAARAWTNILWAATLSGGLAETNLQGVAVWPGDILLTTGTPLDDGKGEATILIER